MVHSRRQGNTIDAGEVNEALRGGTLEGTVQHFAQVDSTNDLALAAAHAGQRTGVWVADAQTGGRGRGGHQWHSAPGDGLYVSVLLTTAAEGLSLQPAGLSLAAGLAAWEAVREVTGITLDIRWPNDLLTRPTPGERSRKVGGVLVEAAFGPAQTAALRYAVVGIGINVAHRQFPPDLANVASSLYLEGWQAPDRQPLLISLLQRLPELLPLRARLLQASSWLVGKRVIVPEEGGYTGVTAGLDQSGFLQVDGDDGVRRTVRSGGVRER